MKPLQFQKVLKEIEKNKENIIVVEGKRDKKSMQEFGFKNIFVLNQDGKSLYEKIEQLESQPGKKKICILTDFDRKGKKLYLLLKKELSVRRVRLDNSLRAILLKLNMPYIESLSRVVGKMLLENNMNKVKIKNEKRNSYLRGG